MHCSKKQRERSEKKKRHVVLSDVDKSERIQVEREFIEEVDEEEEAQHPALE